MINKTVCWLGLLNAFLILFVLVSSDPKAFAAEDAPQAKGAKPALLASTPARPAPIAAAPSATTVFKRMIMLGQGLGAFLGSGDSFTVPEGKRIALEYLSGKGCAAPGFYPELFIVEADSVGNTLGAYRFGAAVPGNSAGMSVASDSNCFVFQQQMRVYFEPGSQVVVTFDGTDPNTTFFWVTLSGVVSDVK
jgi:hypothetical protein